MNEMACKKSAEETALFQRKHGTSRHCNSAAHNAAHDDAELKNVLDKRLSMADAPNAIWHDADDVFEELEAHFVG
jgi:hypothetical protein